MSAKTMMFTKDPVARIMLDSLSKFALADLVVDLLRRKAGAEDLDGVELAREIASAFRPVAAIRGDRVPNVEKIAKKLDERRAALEPVRGRWAP